MVWGGIMGDKKNRPCFIYGNLNAQGYNHPPDSNNIYWQLLEQINLYF